MTDDLIAWLNTQLDEDERVACSAIEIMPRLWVEFADELWKRTAGVDAEALADQVERHSPARVLRDVEAKRWLLRQHEHRRFAEPRWPDAVHQEDIGKPVYEEDPRYVGCVNCEWDYRYEEVNEGWWCDYVRVLATVYSDRTGYREEWRPE